MFPFDSHKYFKRKIKIKLSKQQGTFNTTRQPYIDITRQYPPRPPPPPPHKDQARRTSVKTGQMEVPQLGLV